MPAFLPSRVLIRKDAGTWGLQGALDRRGMGPVAGVDEAGRGACAGPLVVAACVLRQGDGARLTELTDSKLLTPIARDRVYDRVLARALAFSVVVIPPEEVDAEGVHFANIAGMRRAVARLEPHPGYVLTDGFTVPGLTAPSMPVVKGDRVVACVAAASVLAKVTRDRIMTDLHEQYPMYGFDVHKGYSTAEHVEALTQYGPSDVHRWSFANVAGAGIEHDKCAPRRVRHSAASVRARATGAQRAAEDIVSQNGLIAEREHDIQVGGTPAR